MDPTKEIKRLKELERANGSMAAPHNLKESNSGLIASLAIIFVTGLAVLVGMMWSAAVPSEQPTAIATSSLFATRQLLPTPTLAPSREWVLATAVPPTGTPVPTWTVAPLPTPVPTWTMVPTQTPYPTLTAPPTQTPLPTHTPYPTAVPPTWTPQPTWTPTAVPVTATPTPSTIMLPVPPTADTTTINLLADQIASQRRQLWVGGGLIATLFAASLLLLAWLLIGSNRPALAAALRGLRRELAAIREMLAVWVGPDGSPSSPTTPPSPTRQQLPPPVRPPIREARRVVESSESSRRVEPVEPVQLEPVGEVQLPLSKERAPNAEERAYIRRRYAETGNLTAVCMECYDSKGGKVWAWVKSAVERQEAGQRPQQEVGQQQEQVARPPRRPLIINTSRGREVL